jgi:hypothetical protein
MPIIIAGFEGLCGIMAPNQDLKAKKIAARPLPSTLPNLASRGYTLSDVTLTNKPT